MHVAITGAASGIGAAAARRLSDAGHRVTVFDISRPPLADTWHRVDLSDMDAAAAMADAAPGPFDALILNAGLPPRPGNAVPLLTLNVFGFLASARALEPLLAPGGAIVSTASRAGEHWRDNLGQVQALLALPGPAALPGFVAENGIDPLRAYCLSKEAVVLWTMRQTERLLPRDQRANCISPSAVDTPILGDFITALGERAQKSLARTGRAGTPDEIAALIAFLASPDSGWIRGQNITIDGGMTAMATIDALDA